MSLKVFVLLLALTLASKSLVPEGITQVYIIYMDAAKMDVSDPKEYYHSLLHSLAKESTQTTDHGDAPQGHPQLLYAYENVISGFSARLSTKQLDSLKKVDGFLYATTDQVFQPQTTHSPQFLGLQPGVGLWSQSSRMSDMIVGIIDTGIWPEHPSFGDSEMPPIPTKWKGTCQEGPQFSKQDCNSKLIGARKFSDGYTAIFGPLDENVDIPSPRDSNGHGTHTASTAAGNTVQNASIFGLANGTASGMAHMARVAVYKVCWEMGCAESDSLAAIDQAVADGVDVLSFSIGAAQVPFYMDNVAVASFGAFKRDVLFVASAGNSGPSDMTVAHLAPWIMTVAASSQDRSFPAIVTLGNGQSFEGISLYTGKDINNLPLFYSNGSTRFCDQQLDLDSVKGKIVVCAQGNNAPAEKGEIVKSAGGVGMIVANSNKYGEELRASAHILPAADVGANAATVIVNYILSNPNPTASISFRGTTYGNSAPEIAAFSSRGPNPVEPHILKPDITAPGLNILAAWPSNLAPSEISSDRRRVQFNILSGTSMSCPHVSGIAALLKSVHRDWSPAMIKSAMMTTAYTVNNKNGPISDYSTSEPATPFTYGSGHADPERASNPGLVYNLSEDEYLTYLCGLGYNSDQIQVFLGGRSFTCPPDAKKLDLNYPSFSIILESNVSVTYKRTVTNVGSPHSTYHVQVDEPRGISVVVKPQTLIFDQLDQKLSYEVKFAASGQQIGNASFGSVTWASERYTVRSPIAVIFSSGERMQDILDPAAGGKENKYFEDI